MTNRFSPEVRAHEVRMVLGGGLLDRKIGCTLNEG
jgi:hypothetical protein